MKEKKSHKKKLDEIKSIPKTLNLKNVKYLGEF